MAVKKKKTVVTWDSVKEAGIDALRTALATSVAVWLGLGISVFDADAEALKAVAAAGFAALLQVAMKYLDPSFVGYGIGADLTKRADAIAAKKIAAAKKKAK